MTATAHGASSGTRQPELVPLAMLVGEAVDAGVIDWLTDRVTEDGATLTRNASNGGLLAALATAAQRQIATGTGPVRFTVRWDPGDPVPVDVGCSPACTLAVVRDLCLLVAASCTNLRPAVTIHRSGRGIQTLYVSLSAEPEPAVTTQTGIPEWHRLRNRLLRERSMRLVGPETNRDEVPPIAFTVTHQPDGEIYCGAQRRLRPTVRGRPV